MVRGILRLPQSQMFLALLWCVWQVANPHAAEALTNDEVKQAIMDFSADTFKVREAASDKLSKALAMNELTSEQLGFIRVAAGSNDLEVQRRSQVILMDFELSIPTVKDIIEATQVTTKIPGALAGQANYGIDSIFAKTDSSKSPFNDLLKLYESARNSFLGGAANDVEAKFKSLRDRISGLTDDELKALGIDKDTQKEILDKVDDAIKKIPDAVKTIGQGTNNAPPPMRGMAPVPATGGVVNVGLTFSLSVIGSILPGTVDIFSPDDATSLFSPSPGYRFAGEIFDLLESADLDLTGSAVSVGLQFGPGLLSGDPLDPTRPVCLARLANGHMDLLSCSDDPTLFNLTGSYQPESKFPGALQLGEFALVQTVPGPGSLVLLLLGLAVPVVFSLLVRKRRGRSGSAVWHVSSRL